MRAKRRSPLRKAIMGLVAVALALLLLNLAAMGYEYAVHGTVRLPWVAPGIYVDDGPDSKDGHRLRPGVRLDGLGHELAVNSLGFRGPELAPAKGPNTLRVWCAGGSTTFDICVSRDEAAWPAQLQRALAAASPGVKVEVINAGVPGEVLATNLRDFNRLADRLQPDVLVIYQGPNDLRNIANNKFGPQEVKTGWYMELPLVRVLGDLLPPPAPPDAWARHRLEAADLLPFEQQVQALIEAARRRGARVVLASHAFAAADHASAADAHGLMGRDARSYSMTSRNLMAAYRAANQLLRQMAARQGLAFADVRAAVGSAPERWADGIHFTDAGAAVAGKAVADAVVKAGLNGVR